MKSDFSETVKKYGETVYKIAYVNSGNAADSEDIFQETFFALYNYKKEFNDEAHLKAWLIRVTLNKCRMLRRSVWFRRRTEMNDVQLTDSISSVNDTSETVYNAVMKLKKSYRTVILLFYYEGYSCDEIARLTGTNPSTVRTRLSRARILLKEELKEVWNGE